MVLITQNQQGYYCIGYGKGEDTKTFIYGWVLASDIDINEGSKKQDMSEFIGSWKRSLESPDQMYSQSITISVNNNIYKFVGYNYKLLSDNDGVVAGVIDGILVNYINNMYKVKNTYNEDTHSENIYNYKINKYYKLLVIEDCNDLVEYPLSGVYIPN